MTQRKLYTIVLDYKGGTYIAQVSGDSPAAALSNWLSEIRDQELAEWGITRGEIKAIMDTDDPTPVSGCSGVWCVTGSTKKGLVLVNVVATDGSS